LRQSSIFHPFTEVPGVRKDRTIFCAAALWIAQGSATIMPMEAAAVSVFAYADYRVFLKDYYERARRIDRRFSHRYISSKMGFASASWFNDLLKGRTNLAGTHLVKLAGLLKLKDTEADYLETLIQYNQANSIEEKNRYYKKLASFKEVNVDIVGREKFEFYSKWYHSAIRELLFFIEFRGDFESLAKKLNPALKTSQAKEAISLLEKLGFIRKDAQGAFRPASAMLKKDASFKSLYAANYLKANMELGMQALEGFQKEERHISAITLSFSKPGFDKAISEIESLRKRLMVLMKEDTRPDKVFQFNVQFFPVTN
jgi:uncharacterized protein (TIGR02147 family)